MSVPRDLGLALEQVSAAHVRVGARDPTLWLVRPRIRLDRPRALNMPRYILEFQTRLIPRRLLAPDGALPSYALQGVCDAITVCLWLEYGDTPDRPGAPGSGWSGPHIHAGAYDRRGRWDYHLWPRNPSGSEDWTEVEAELEAMLRDTPPLYTDTLPPEGSAP